MRLFGWLMRPTPFSGIFHKSLSQLANGPETSGWKVLKTKEKNMRTLQKLLTVLDGQKLSPGYLTPTKPTALEYAIDLKKQLDTGTINLTGYQSPGNLLFASAWVGSLRAGIDAIWLNGPDGNLDLSHGSGPALIFTEPV
jgi:hypothetical protein